MGSGNSGSIEISATILAYTGTNIYLRSGASATPEYSDIFAESSHNLPLLGATNLTVEPGLLDFDSEYPSTDVHLGPESWSIDAGPPGDLDPDGSRADIGAYGDTLAASWNLDGDSWTDYFWPGEISSPPPGFQASDFDEDDLDPATH